MADGRLTEEQKEVLVGIGVATIAAQHTERLLDFSLTYVLQVRGALTVESLRKHNLSKRTLGQVLSTLREHIGVEDRFDAYLTEYLNKRNALVHDLQRIPGWSLNSKDGIATAHAFLHRLLALDKIIVQVLVALFRAWLASLPPGVPFPPLPPLDMEELPPETVDHIFFEKGAAS